MIARESQSRDLEANSQKRGRRLSKTTRGKERPETRRKTKSSQTLGGALSKSCWELNPRTGIRGSRSLHAGESSIGKGSGGQKWA